MFRAAAAGPYDEAINKATDENLTSEDWGAIMEVCDRVATNPNGAKEAVQSMIKRLAHRNANVQLYTLEVANALSQNCGKPMHRELSSRAFTDALLKLANDRNTHTQVKTKILERMKEWTDMFKSDPDLGIMYDAYYRLKQTNPTLQPPSAPQKNRLTDLDRQKEEDELQMALQLSLQEEERKKKASAPAQPSGPAGGAAGPGQAAQQQQQQQQAAQPLQPVASGTTAATVSRVRALFDFQPSEPGELEFKKGDVIAVLESVYKDWWRGSLKGKTGIFPLNYVEKLTDPTPDELQREAQMEAEVFAEIKNVEKLLTLLSTTNSGPREEDNDEIEKLYHHTLAIRPKLIKLIEKYSQKKDDFTQLNEKFIKARRDYEALLESSMAHPPAPTYHQYAMRPQIPPTGYAGTPGPGGYAAPAPQQQDAQRYYTPGPGQASQYPPTSPSPQLQRPGLGPASSSGGAPFYVAGAEVPPQAGQQPPAPSQAQQQQPPQQQYPQRERLPSGGGPGPKPQQPAPLQTSSSPPPAGPPAGQQYQAYQAPPSGRPQSVYTGGPQELSTSVYDSPIAPHNPSSYYSPTTEDPYAAAAVSSPTASSAPPQPSGPAPSAPGGYQPYTPYHVPPPTATPSQPAHAPPQPPQQQQNPYGGGGYDSGYDAYETEPPAQMRPGPAGGAPPPLQPSGSAYDARQTLPSRLGGAGAAGGGGYGGLTGGVTGGGGPGGYKPYVPPSAPADSNDGPSAPGDYYRTAAY